MGFFPFITLTSSLKFFPKAMFLGDQCFSPLLSPFSWNVLNVAGPILQQNSFFSPQLSSTVFEVVGNEASRRTKSVPLLIC